MKHSVKNIILSVISISCLLIAICIFFGGVDKAYAANIASKGYIKDKSKVIILVGDSRVKQMSYLNAKSRKNFLLVFSSGGGIDAIDPEGGYRWMGDILVSALNKYPYAPVVFALGVNFNGNPINNAKCTTIYDYYIKYYPSHSYIISTVGGTGKRTTPYNNSNVVEFNKKLKEKYVDNIKEVRKSTGNKNIYFYDLYEFLKDAKLINPGKSNKGTRDGLHYKNKVYKGWLKDLRSFVDYGSYKRSR